jgi:ADP-ribose pyrophosphatase YjhB (NUDIX family)
MREAAVMLVVNSDGYILGVSRRDDITKFGLPGGKCEPGETPAESAVRETKEETCIMVYACDPIYTREEPASHPGGLSFFTYCYYAVNWQGTPKDSEEGVVKWLTVDELTSSSGAFPVYNRNTIDAFKKLNPHIKLQGDSHVK